MTKTYNSPMLQVVSIKKNDILTESVTVGTNAFTGMEMQVSGRRFDVWYEGH